MWDCSAKLNYCLAAPDVPLTALSPMATLETSPEANCDRRTDRMTEQLIGARATTLPKNNELFLWNFLPPPHFAGKNQYFFHEWSGKVQSYLLCVMIFEYVFNSLGTLLFFFAKRMNHISPSFVENSSNVFSVQA